MTPEPLLFCVGTPVEKPNGYPFPGVVVAEFHTLAGAARYVVESDLAPGMLHIFSSAQLRVRPISEGEAFLRAAEEEFGPAEMLEQAVEIVEDAMELEEFGTQPGQVADAAGRIIGSSYELIETGVVGISRREVERASRYGWTVCEGYEDSVIPAVCRDFDAAEPFLNRAPK